MAVNATLDVNRRATVQKFGANPPKRQALGTYRLLLTLLRVARLASRGPGVPALPECPFDVDDHAAEVIERHILIEIVNLEDQVDLGSIGAAPPFGLTKSTS